MYEITILEKTVLVTFSFYYYSDINNFICINNGFANATFNLFNSKNGNWQQVADKH